MNRRIRRLGLAFVVLYAALFVQLNWLHVVKASEYNASPNNDRAVVRDFTQARGTINSADGVLLARSVPSNDRYVLQREYPTGDLFAHVVGTFSFAYGGSGVEQAYNDELAGQTAKQKANDLASLFGGGDRTVGDVTLTLRADVQRIAKAALGDHDGSVVAMDPRTGAILAMWSQPSFDPNTLSAHDFTAVGALRRQLLADPRDPLLAAAYQERYFPGSTFKIVTATAGLDSGQVTENTPVYEVRTQYVPPLTTNPIHNFNNVACGGPLLDILRVSCNTAFAQMGVDLGAPIMVSAAERFGFNQTVPFDLSGAAKSFFPDLPSFTQNTPKLAQSAIGQNDVQASPLEMAMVAAAVANGGILMKPHVLKEIRNPDGSVLRSYESSVWRTAMTSATASVLREAMIEIVRSGTATRMAIPGVTVAGKTGTAQLGTTPASSHAWVIGFAPADNPVVAVAVLVKAQPGVSEITGGQVAAPIARQVILEVLKGNGA